MVIKCFWEHNGDDTLLYSTDFPGAYARGKSLEAARSKMPQEICSYLSWCEQECCEKDFEVVIAEKKSSELNICDADSDAIFLTETMPMRQGEYERLKVLALKSASDFLRLYNCVPDKDKSCLAERKTFYGAVPRTAKEMYEHTKNVNSYYFGEIGINADNGGDILSCRRRGFELSECKPDYLGGEVFAGSWGESWSLKKVLRRFIWHDRIHAKAMYRMAIKTFGKDSVPDIFCFGSIN